MGGTDKRFFSLAHEGGTKELARKDDLQGANGEPRGQTAKVVRLAHATRIAAMPPELRPCIRHALRNSTNVCCPSRFTTDRRQAVRRREVADVPERCVLPAELAAEQPAPQVAQATLVVERHGDEASRHARHLREGGADVEHAQSVIVKAFLLITLRTRIKQHRFGPNEAVDR